MPAEQGDTAAQVNLGIRYYSGKGVPQDYTEAVKWYRMAAEQGDAQAQYNLGIMYLEGKGVPQDDTAAYMWLNLSAAQGNAKAADARDIIGKKLNPTDLSEGQRRARVCLASTYQDCD
jgi:TPR repeat protein